MQGLYIGSSMYIMLTHGCEYFIEKDGDSRFWVIDNVGCRISVHESLFVIKG